MTFEKIRSLNPYGQAAGGVISMTTGSAGIATRFQAISNGCIYSGVGIYVIPFIANNYGCTFVVVRDLDFAYWASF
jgi:hypothetical protein